MTCTLYWKPVSKEHDYVNDHVLRDILEKKFGFPAQLNHTHIEYLSGLRDAGREQAFGLIDAIHEHGVIEINKEC